MGRTGTLLFLTVLMCAAAPLGAVAQMSGVVITSSPPGAVVELSGDYDFRGVTPWRLDRGLIGDFDLRAVKRGYEDWNGNTLLSGTRRDSLHIALTAKTPLRAGIRSGIVPGWGQYYSGQRTKGTLFLVAELAALGATLWADVERQDALDEYEAARRAYRNADQVDEIESAYEVMLIKYDDLDKWHERRRRLAYVAAAVWLANVLDATLLFPQAGGDTFAAMPASGGSGPYAAFDGERTSIGVAIEF